MEKKQKEIELVSTEKIKVSELNEREKMIFDAGYSDGVDTSGYFLLAAIVLFAILMIALVGIHNHYQHGSFWAA